MQADCLIFEIQIRWPMHVLFGCKPQNWTQFQLIFDVVNCAPSPPPLPRRWSEDQQLDPAGGRLEQP